MINIVELLAKNVPIVIICSPEQAVDFKQQLWDASHNTFIFDPIKDLHQPICYACIDIERCRGRNIAYRIHSAVSPSIVRNVQHAYERHGEFSYDFLHQGCEHVYTYSSIVFKLGSFTASQDSLMEFLTA